MIAENAPLTAAPFRGVQVRGRHLPRHRLNGARRIDAHVAVAAVLRVAAERPFEKVAAVCPASQADPLQL
ncbi:MAG: hypothetical protein HW394_2070, partial [Acidobacteria bacterium]|nr:hypothetical protein [Acidobacteriota bacterium]